MCGSRMDSLDELYLCLSSLFICATVSTGVSQYMAVATPIDDDDGDGEDELDRFDVLMMTASVVDQEIGEEELRESSKLATQRML